MFRLLLLCVFLIPIIVLGQSKHLKGFENLVGKTWKAEGEWSIGGKFKQEISYNYDLQGTIVVTNTKGFTNGKQTKYGSRNHGVRQYNANDKTVEFWEFDVFGGKTKGIVKIKDKDIWYQYEYGDIIITDWWQYVDDKTYKYSVGIYKEDKWQNVYLETYFRLKE